VGRRSSNEFDFEVWLRRSSIQAPAPANTPAGASALLVRAAQPKGPSSQQAVLILITDLILPTDSSVNTKFRNPS
jgi:hypothetical protein